jgi:hypothetical protein
MKTSIWDILTGVTLFGILCLIVGFGIALSNRPQEVTKAEQLVPTISIPTATNTVQGMPPTWTPQAQQLGATATLRPTSTQPPTATSVVLPTFTASPRAPVTGGGSANCRVVFQSPADDTYQSKNTSFQMRWTIQNTSGTTWQSASSDIRFVSGDRMQTGADVYDLPYDVANNSNVDILINMRTPSGTGTVNSNWSIVQGSTTVCKFFVEFKLK